jgi:hypothetical protein
VPQVQANQLVAAAVHARRQLQGRRHSPTHEVLDVPEQGIDGDVSGAGSGRD